MLADRARAALREAGLWGISCAFSWTYAFLSSLSADQSLGYCGSCPGELESGRPLGKSDGPGVWLQGIRRTTRPLVECARLGRMTSNSINRGLAAMPAQERSLRVDGRGLGGDQSHNQRQHREAMARNTSPKGSNPRADVQPSQWDDADWDQDHDEAARLSRAPAVVEVELRLSSARRSPRGAAPMARRRTLGKAPCRRDRGPDGDLRRLLRRAVVAAWRRSDQSRNGHALAGRGDRGKYRPRQYRRGRAARRSSGPAESASPCASAISSSGIATMPSWRARRKPR